MDWAFQGAWNKAPVKQICCKIYYKDYCGVCVCVCEASWQRHHGFFFDKKVTSSSLVEGGCVMCWCVGVLVCVCVVGGELGYLNEKPV